MSNEWWMVSSGDVVDYYEEDVLMGANGDVCR